MSSRSNRKSKNAGPGFGPLVFNVYKPEGMTSSDVVRHFKYHLPKGFGKIGHFGTLDPFAEGVLLIAIGQAPRFNDYIHEKFPKTYLATGVLGVESPTGDFTVAEEELDFVECSEFSEDKLVSIIESFKGEYSQSPPAFSATKHQGKPLYEWARQGVIIEKPEVQRHISEIELVELNGRVVTFRVTASSGTYIRVLFEDIAKKLGTHGALKNLVRESIGPAHIEKSLLEEAWPKRDADYLVEEFGTRIDNFLDFPKLELSENEAVKFFNGLAMHKDFENGFFWALHNGKLLGLGEFEDNLLRVRVGFGHNPLEKN
ncbi:tRNA pseudouridine(55) synthase TruB [Halobacteriovorax sp. JY17]|uniref:tRNA pseudouridine(55) synthase TruB n=1 Tax=Halobacteriovorax sp. JY17 TaxID=2014617 RepID=UPI000C661C53|nr:tRNA pseudouridine(55) synthase TruB [Halobacteriovorax sp. JY17]PIK15811.1 MAG: tRNA pseudouridine(55) synthase TruB [Halobacteriovorax sp. JY17]